MIRRFIIAWRFVAALRLYDPLASRPESWEEVDSLNLSAFMLSDTGKRLMAKLNNFEYTAAVTACSVEEKGERYRSIAHGVRLTLLHIAALGGQARKIREAAAQSSQTDTEAGTDQPGVPSFAINTGL